VSGGPDSTALLMGLRELGRDVSVAHFDHRLRPDSAADAAHVARLSESLGVALISRHRDRPLPPGSVQAGARSLRYAFLEEARRASGSDLVLLAHTADDVVEGVLLHLLRGSGLAGLRGMPDRRGPYARPLLDVWRHDLAAYLAARGVEALEDPANQDLRYARAQVRLRLLPTLERDLPGFARRVHAVARWAARRQVSLEAEAADLLSRQPVSRSLLEAASPALRVEALRQLYLGAGGSLPALSRRNVTSMERVLTPGRQRGIDLPGGLRFRVTGDRVEMLSAGAEPARGGQHRLVVRSCRGCSAPDAVHLRAGHDYRLGHRRPGLRMRPLGGRGTRKLQDILVDARVPRDTRDALPLVFAGDRLAWVPGIAVESELVAPFGEDVIHVAVAARRAPRRPKIPVLESGDYPLGESL
jgi:tRNA(Ile)-lysidine synthetase-like protein